MTPIDLLACLVVGVFIGLGALGLGYGIFAIVTTARDVIYGPMRSVSVNMPSDVHRYAERLKERR